MWVAMWIAILVVGALGLVASANSLRFRHRVAREVREMWSGSAEPRQVDRRQLESLPAPVRRYYAKAVGERTLAVRTVRLRHGGTFRMKLDGAWLPIRGKQYFAADPPGFVWWGHVRAAPGFWFDARDRSVGGVGNMRAMVESTFTVVDSCGEGIDQGSLLRLLGEMVWLPTALFDDRRVTWTPIDDHRARATLRMNGHEVAGVFEFGDDHLPARILADRFRDVDGKAVLTPWSGECGDYRAIEGLLVPHQLTAFWHVDGQRIPYARFSVERLDFDATVPF